jgi:hypothetical protein
MIDGEKGVSARGRRRAGAERPIDAGPPPAAGAPAIDFAADQTTRVRAWIGE